MKYYAHTKLSNPFFYTMEEDKIVEAKKCLTDNWKKVIDKKFGDSPESLSESEISSLDLPFEGKGLDKFLSEEEMIESYKKHQNKIQEENIKLRNEISEDAF